MSLGGLTWSTRSSMRDVVCGWKSFRSEAKSNFIHEKLTLIFRWYFFRLCTRSDQQRHRRVSEKRFELFFLSEISRLNFTPHSCLYERHSNTPSPNLAAEDERHRGFLRLIIAPRAILLSRALELMFCVTLLAVCAQESWWVKMGRGETRRERWEIF